MVGSPRPGTVGAVALPHGAGTVVVYGWSSDTSPRWDNIELLSPDGSVIWRAKLPDDTTNPDCFVHVAWDGNLLRANSWSGWVVWIDPETGRTVRAEFVK